MSRINNSDTRRSERRVAVAKRLEAKLKRYYVKDEVPEKLKNEIKATGFQIIQMHNQLLVQ